MVIAGRDGVDQGVITNRLKVIGYLLMHTRQLDMILLEPRLVRHYQDKIDTDIGRVLGPPGGKDHVRPE